MDKDEFPESTKEDKRPSNGLKEVLGSIRIIFVAVIALVISVSEWISKRFSHWQAKSEEQSKIINARREQELARLEKSRKAEELAIREEQRLAAEKAKIAEEQRAEERAIREQERAIREEERKSKEKKLSAKKIIYPTLSAMSTIALISGVTMLAPIAKWTRSQNECIAKAAIDSEMSQAEFTNQVMRCNGGHE